MSLIENTEQATESVESVQQSPAVEQVQQTVEQTIQSPAATNQQAIELSQLLSEEYRDLGNLKDFKDVNQLAKSYVELQRMVGNSIRIPGQDASEEARQDFLNKIKDVEGVLIKNDEQLLNKLGKPETADEYDFSTLTEDQFILEDLNNFKQTAHELGLTKEQASKLAEIRAKEFESLNIEMESTRKAGEEALRKAWGQDFDNRLNAAKQMAKVLQEKHGEAMDQIINGPAGNNPAIINMLADLAESYREKGHEGVQATQFGMTPEGALAKIAEKRADRGFMEAYGDDLHPNHKKAVKELSELYSIANGS